jgi:ribonucleoside-diphosphate reductase beta chain
MDQTLNATGSEIPTMVEPMLRLDEKRYTLFPIRHRDIWSAYKNQEACFWTSEEIDLASDMADWKKLSSDEQHFIMHVLAFFAASDGIVNQNLAENLSSKVQWLEAKVFYRFQMMMEDIHSETYSLLIDSFVEDGAMKNKLFNAIENIPCVAKKAQWAIDWIENPNATFAQHLVAFAVVEGIFFSGSFCAIFWLKKQGKMPGLCFANELISRDEGMHQRFAVLLHSKLDNPLDEETIHGIVSSAVELEKEFVCEALSVSLLGMNAALMSQYIEFVADVLLDMLGVGKLYNVNNPFEWMDLISLSGKTNFFEKRVGEYRKAGISEHGREGHAFNMDDDF